MIDTNGARTPRYTVIIQWDEESKSYVVSLPEWGPYCKAYGASYEEAARNAQDVLELLVEDETSLPQPQFFHYPGACAVDLPDSSVGSADKNAAPQKTKQTA